MASDQLPNIETLWVDMSADASVFRIPSLLAGISTPAPLSGRNVVDGLLRYLRYDGTDRRATALATIIIISRPKYR